MLNSNTLNPLNPRSSIRRRNRHVPRLRPGGLRAHALQLRLWPQIGLYHWGLQGFGLGLGLNTSIVKHLLKGPKVLKPLQHPPKNLKTARYPPNAESKSLNPKAPTFRDILNLPPTHHPPQKKKKTKQIKIYTKELPNVLQSLSNPKS